MSIINKVIADLEERQVLGSNNAGKVFRGLSAAENLPRSYTNSLVQMFILILFLFASVSATYALMARRDSVVLERLETLEPGDNSLQIISEPRSVGRMRKQQAGLPSSLKLDFSLSSIDSLELRPLSEPLDPAPRLQNDILVSDIELNRDKGNILLELSLSNEASYRAYPLRNPNRVVIHIARGRLATAFTATELDGVRIIDRGEDEVMLVVDTQAYQSVEDVQLHEQGQHYKLSFLLKPVLALEDEELPAEVAEQRVDVPHPEREIAHYGEMTKSRSDNNSTENIAELYRQAKRLYRQGNSLKADKLLYEILEKDSSYLQARTLLAKKLIARARLEEAEAILDEGLRQVQAVPDWADLHARLLINRGLVSQAIDTLKAASPVLEKSPEYYAFLAALYQKSDRHLEAIQTYRRVVEHEENNSVWWMGLAISLEATGRNPEALFAYRKSLQGAKLSPDLQQYVHGKIAFLDRQGRG